MAQRTLLSRAILERIKLRAALPLVAGLLEEGWHVLLFVQYRSDKTLDLTSPEAVEAFLQDAEERGAQGGPPPPPGPGPEGPRAHPPSPVAMVREAFGGLGEDLAFYTGAETGSALRRTKAAWDEGRVRLLLATAGKGVWASPSTTPRGRDLRPRSSSPCPGRPRGWTRSWAGWCALE